MGETLTIGGIHVEVAKKAIKNLHLTVHPPHGRVHIVAPERMQLDTIRLYAISKLPWLRRQIAELQAQARESSREYVNRESHFVWGSRYLLKVVEREAPPTVELHKRQLVLAVRPGTSEAQRHEILAAWHRAQVRAAVVPLLAKWQRILKVEARAVATTAGFTNGTAGVLPGHRLNVPEGDVTAVSAFHDERLGGVVEPAEGVDAADEIVQQVPEDQQGEDGGDGGDDEQQARHAQVLLVDALPVDAAQDITRHVVLVHDRLEQGLEVPAGLVRETEDLPLGADGDGRRRGKGEEEDDREQPAHAHEDAGDGETLRAARHELDEERRRDVRRARLDEEDLGEAAAPHADGVEGLQERERLLGRLDGARDRRDDFLERDAEAAVRVDVPDQEPAGLAHVRGRVRDAELLREVSLEPGRRFCTLRRRLQPRQGRSPSRLLRRHAGERNPRRDHRLRARRHRPLHLPRRRRRTPAGQRRLQRRLLPQPGWQAAARPGIR